MEDYEIMDCERFTRGCKLLNVSNAKNMTTWKNHAGILWHVDTAQKATKAENAAMPQDVIDGVLFAATKDSRHGLLHAKTDEPKSEMLKQLYQTVFLSNPWILKNPSFQVSRNVKSRNLFTDQ